MTPGPFHLIWKRSAIEIDLARAVVTAIENGHDVGAITRAMEDAERALAGDPNAHGESRPGFERVARFPPLTVWYAVHEEERVAYALRVVYAPPRRR